MEDFHVRLLQELNDLLAKKTKLHEFLISEKVKNLKHIQQSLLWVQLTAMDTYATCLQERINDLERERINDN